MTALAALVSFFAKI